MHPLESMHGHHGAVCTGLHLLCFLLHLIFAANMYYVLTVLYIFGQNNKGKGRLKYLLQQTEIFAHFAKGSQSNEKKPRGR
jgi:hypothetical protein